MHSLPVFLRLRGETVIVLGEGKPAEEKIVLIERAGGRVVRDEQAVARYAFVALDTFEKTAAAVERLRARGILVNAVDRPALCDFTIPAIVDRDPVIVAVGTGGASAGLAGVLRERLEVMLPPAIGAFAAQLDAMKTELRARFPDHRARRAEIARMLDERELAPKEVPAREN